MKTSELTNAALDWAVAKAENKTPQIERLVSFPNKKHVRVYIDVIYDNHGRERIIEYAPSTNWSQGGPIIEREGLGLDQFADYPRWKSGGVYGPTPLIAAMRCYVASRLGDEVDVPPTLI